MPGHSEAVLVKIEGGSRPQSPVWTNRQTEGRRAPGEHVGGPQRRSKTRVKGQENLEKSSATDTAATHPMGRHENDRRNIYFRL